ncbi:hypothetical protein PUN28_016752 [Cardiocondyla obscurior]|uniref:Uncharacterized protein n=1 Tax=Cardiocondyla obscurior TaxID=286306 RepID=A0AAW2ESE2_9HYME
MRAGGVDVKGARFIYEAGTRYFIFLGISRALRAFKKVREMYYSLSLSLSAENVSLIYFISRKNVNRKGS